MESDFMTSFYCTTFHPHTHSPTLMCGLHAAQIAGVVTAPQTTMSAVTAVEAALSVNVAARDPNCIDIDNDIDIDFDIHRHY